MPVETLVGSDEEVLAGVFSDASDEVLVVTPRLGVVAATARALDELDPPDNVRLLTDRSTGSRTRREFAVATRLVEFARRDLLALRSLDAEVTTSLVLTSDRVASLVPLSDDETVALVTDDEEAVFELRGKYVGLWADATPVDLETPAYSDLLESLGERLGDDVEADVATVFESVPTTRGVADTLDEVDVTLLMAARNGKQFYELNRWGEDVGLASAATFSQAKQRLERAGLVTTEKVEREGVGRPRQRLVLSTDSLRDVPPAELVSAARSVLAE